MAKSITELIQQNEVKFVDLRFTDTSGKAQHVSVPVSAFDDDKFESGHAFDGSSIAGWKGIEASDMLLVPDANTAFIDPFYEESTLVLTCDVVEPADGKGYERDPRSLAKRAEAYLKSTGLGDTAYFGPEPEFFIFDSVQWNTDMSGSFVKIGSDEAPWSSAREIEGGNTGYRPGLKGGYFPVAPVDTFQDIRSEICLLLEQIGIPVEVHHREVAGQGQNEIGTKFSTLVQRADWTQQMKYIIHNVQVSALVAASGPPRWHSAWDSSRRSCRIRAHGQVDRCDVFDLPGREFGVGDMLAPESKSVCARAHRTRCLGIFAAGPGHRADQSNVAYLFWAVSLQRRYRSTHRYGFA